jgi:microcystin-dependent protein
MSSVFRYYENPPIHQVGDTKTSALFFDHAGWLLCDGRLLDKNNYNNLYNIIGTSFGESEDGTQFAIPNPAGRVPAIVGQAEAGMNIWNMGDISGEEKHTLTIAEMPSHRHGPSDVTGNTDGTGLTGPSGSAGESEQVGSGSGPLVAGSNDHAHSIGRTGGNLPHNNIQPTIFMGHMFMYGGF